MDRESSSRLALLRFPLIVAIVFIHNFGTSVGMAGGDIGVSHNNALVEFIQLLISNELARTAVPLFFLMSGYLFFYRMEWDGGNYLKKLRSRATSLLLPFLFWNGVTLLAIAIAQSIPSLSVFFSGRLITRVADYGWFDYPASLLGIGRAPISYQFWFIRDLMLLIVATPLIYLLNRHVPRLFLALLCLCWFLGIGWYAIPSIESALFFCVGCYIGMQQLNIKALDLHGPKLVAAWIVLSCVVVAFRGADWQIYPHRLAILIGIVGVWYLTSLVVQNRRFTEGLLLLSPASFFVYAAHEPALTVMRKLAYKILRPESSGLTLLLYFAIPILLIAILLAIHFLLMRAFPKFTNAITGGR